MVKNLIGSTDLDPLVDEFEQVLDKLIEKLYSEGKLKSRYKG